MTTEKLERQVELANELLATLERIKAVWAEMPTEDDLATLQDAATNIASVLGQAKETFNDPSFPTEDDLREVAEAAGSITSL